MKRSESHTRGFFVWLALAAYVLFGGNAVAGIVTCFGFDGHIAAEGPHGGGINRTTAFGFEVPSTNHGPCVDVSVQSLAKATQEKVLPRSDGGATSVAVVVPSQVLPGTPLLRGVVWPTAPPSGSALLEFAETVRLLI